MKHTLATRLYNAFYYDFLDGRDTVRKYLPGFDTETIISVSRQLGTPTRAHEAVKAILAEQNADYAAAQAQENLRKLDDPQCRIIITGQQLGFLLSPVYTIYKAITTVNLARQLNSTGTEFNFIPVFWLETEDHDFEEIRSAGVWDRDLRPVMVNYHGESQLQTSVRHHLINEDIGNTFAELGQSLMSTEFTGDLLEKLRTIYAPGRSWTAATRDLFREIFSQTGLLFFEPGTEAIKHASSEFFQSWIANIGPVISSFSRQTLGLESDGYQAQVPDFPGKTYIHIEDDERRRQHIYYDNGRFQLKDRPEQWSDSELRAILDKQPGRFSTAVASRPVLQSWLLPVAAYIAGPAEIAYWAQLGQLFETMAVGFPVVYPRLSATLLEPKIARYAEKHMAELSNPPVKMHAYIDAHFQRNQYDSERFSEWRRRIEETFREIGDYISELDPTLNPVAEKTGERIEGQIEQLENRLLKAVEQKATTLRGHLEQIHAVLFPLEQPQERFATIVYYLNKFGPDFFDKLLALLEQDPKRHQILHL